MKKAVVGMNGKNVLYRGLELNTSRPGWFHSLDEQPVKSFLRDFLSDEPVFTVTTSGSTGAPKDIELEKKHMRASAQKTLEFLNLKPGDTCLLCLPVEKIAGIMMLVRWLEGGLDLNPVGPTSSPLREVEGSFEFAAMVPLQVRQSLDDLHRVKKLIIGGGPVDAELEQQLREMPGEIFHTYGMTETISHVAMRKINGKDAQDYFVAVPGVSFTTDGRSCLVIDAPHIGVQQMATNDVVQLLSSTRFRWIGRADNVVNSGGLKLHPELLEQKLGEARFDYFLTGMPDERLGEKLALIVDRKAGADIHELQSFASRLTGYERPREIYVADFYRSVNEKLQRKKIMEEGNVKLVT